ncbi:TetR/AcrR family transcriptional regulator [Streptomyces sp. CA-106110]|uniref:TetR/AcrR family transcriptional regulator n=1 Tax=Streptomyces sp. CA-106110 TaxID=3240044 RepID=UPI003D94113F
MTERNASAGGGRRTTAETQDRIRNAAVDAFMERGYDGVGLREIAKRAGVDPRLVGHYFGSKEGLFAEALELTMEMPSVGRKESAAAFLAQLRSERSMAGLLMTIRSTSNPQAVEIMREMIEHRFQHGLADQLLGEQRHERAALILAIGIGILVMREVIGVAALNGDVTGLTPYLEAVFEAVEDGPAVDRPEATT